VGTSIGPVGPSVRMSIVMRHTTLTTQVARGTLPDYRMATTSKRRTLRVILFPGVTASKTPKPT
ncbi:unnamed protein product, partial [Amoebophrya sp. A120]